MNWLKLELRHLNSPTVLGASCEHVKLWVRLIGYCAQTENSGVLAGAEGWSEHLWLSTIGPGYEAVREASGLWSWQGGDLVVFGYCVDSEGHYAKKREAARIGGLRTQERRRREMEAMEAKSRQGRVGAKARGQAHALAHGKAIDRQIDRQIDKNASHSSGGVKSNGVWERKRPIDFEDPLRSRMTNVGRLFNRVKTSWWSPEELAAWDARGLSEIPTEEWNPSLAVLRQYYRRDWGKAEDFRRRKLVTLLENWPDDVEACRRRLKAEELSRDPGGFGNG